ncbi:ankyrin repeat domain-containing protein [Rubellicoccus peritrichatus]|uniref:Ankyrin repeat domain-containing protein n=1 Tax=Rubellicoccus peritrichatus TaxID=3080537 RepID=A0AAQ3QTW5_9BACT|nr:ankyrin repeat domain-containing protein [Puniceicoccus sp. CR14]WOO39375.1 ankyrin repeat domain-containing protein [Puniceicoccus sp. CR14]
MNVKELSERPNIDYLGAQAKALLKQYRKGDNKALEQIRNHFPKYKSYSLEAIQAAKFGLQDALLVISREYGFANWSLLKHHVEKVSAPSLSEDTRALIKASAQGDAKAVRRLLSEGADAKHVCTYYGQGNERYKYEPPLLQTVRNGHAECAELLLQYGAQTIAGHWSALAEARKCNQTKIVELLEDYQAGAFDLHRALSAHDLDKIRSILKRTPSLASSFEGSHDDIPAPLFLAAQLGETEAVSLLLEAGADPHAAFETTTFTALTTARYHGHQDIVILLEDLGAESLPLTDCIYAASQGDLTKVVNFIRDGVGINEKDICKHHILPHAFFSGNHELVNWLIANGADINQSLGWENYLWFRRYISCGDYKTLRFILDLGFKLNSPGQYGVQLIEEARKHEQQEIAQLLEERMKSESV